MSSSSRTRSSSSHSIFRETLEDPPMSELPTRLQVGRHFHFLKKSKYSNNKDTVPHVAQALIDLWVRAGIPTQPLKNVKTKVLRLVDQGSQASKQGKQAEKTRKFMATLNQVFEIAACQCQDFATCNCPKDQKVPVREREFLTDQRTTRKMQIGAVDKQVTAMMKRRQSREEKAREREDKDKRRKMVREEKLSIEELDLPASSSSESSNNSEDDNPCRVQEQERNMVPIPTIALEADRYGVSNRATAAISTATLVDYGIINPEDKNNIIDPNKVWRARQQLRKDLRANANEEDVTALFFDGRKDKTLVKEYIEGKWYGDKQTEDHYVLIGEPGTSYLSHITLERGTAACIADGLHRAIEEMGITDNIKAVGADSTPVNTGHLGGAIHLLEIRLGRALQWIICQLHLNELPFRHLCTALIGGTEGPANWKGPIGKALPTCELLPISETGFQSIPNGEPLPEIDLDVLSTDQAYLYKIVTAVRTGVISDDLLREKPGQMFLA